MLTGFIFVSHRANATPTSNHPDTSSHLSPILLESGRKLSKDSLVIWKGLGKKLSIRQDHLGLLSTTGYLSLVKYNPGIERTKLFRSLPGYILEYDLGETNLALFSPSSLEQLHQIAEKAHHIAGFCGSIETLDLSAALVETKERYPHLYHSRAYFKQLDMLLSAMSVDNIKQSVQTISTDFTSRFHAHSSGIAFTGWLEDKFKAIFSDRNDVVISQISHAITQQKSLVVKINGVSKSDEIVIIGAHLDSIASPTDNAPGADDNATGIASLLQLAQIIASSNLTFSRSVELHAYAAEEIGLIGSREIANSYQKSGKKVVSMMQIDMAAYTANRDDNSIYLLDTDTSYEQTQIAKDFLKSYKFASFKTGTISNGATSDHKAWYERGYPTLFAFENPQGYNPHIHTTADTIDKLNSDKLLLSINKLALTKLVYAAGLTSYQDAYNEQEKDLWASASVGIQYFIGPKVDGENQDFWLATDQSVTKIDICEVSSKTAGGCSSEKSYINTYLDNDRYRFFDASTLVSLKPGMNLRIEAFTGDSLVGHRHLSFQ